MLELFGYTKAEISTIKIPMLHPVEALEKSKWAFETIIRDGFVRFEVAFKKKNGDLVSTEVSSSLFEIGGYKVIQGIVRDISKRKLAEEALRESEEKYKLLAENSADLIYKISLENGQCTYASPSAERMIGYKKEEVIGRPVFDIYTPDSAERAKSTIFPMFLKTGLIDGEELQLLRKDGNAIDVSLNVSAIRDVNGNIVESRSILRDISKQIEMKKDREKLILHLQEALKEIKALRGILPLCSFCKRVRDDQGYWEQVDVYILKHSLADISHSICPECAKEHYPHFDISED